MDRREQAQQRDAGDQHRKDQRREHQSLDQDASGEIATNEPHRGGCADEQSAGRRQQSKLHAEQERRREVRLAQNLGVPLQREALRREYDERRVGERQRDREQQRHQQEQRDQRRDRIDQQ